MDVNAKQLFKKPVTEADELPPRPRVGLPPRRSGPPMPRRRDELEGDPAADVERVIGTTEIPKAQFTPKELSQLKDVLIQILASMLGSDLDKQIGLALINGQPLDPGQLQHIVDEARRAEIPESHGPLMQKIFSQIGQ